MLQHGRLSDGAKELHELSRTYSTPDGNLVRGRAFVRRKDGQDRFEIIVDGFGQYAVVDAASTGELKRLMAVAMDAFAASAQLRGSFSVRFE